VQKADALQEALITDRSAQVPFVTQSVSRGAWAWAAGDNELKEKRGTHVIGCSRVIFKSRASKLWVCRSKSLEKASVQSDGMSLE
jgi:hypothetical protein